MPNTHRRRNSTDESRVGGVYSVHNSQLVGDSFDESGKKFADSEVELRRVGAVNARAVGSRDPVYDFLCCWAIEVCDKWRHDDVIVENVINIDRNSRSQTAMESVWSVSKLSTKSVGSRRELVANCDADAKQLDSCDASAVCIGL